MGKIDRNSFEGARSLTGGLKAKSRRRRESLERLVASSSPARAPRNDLLPPLDPALIPLDDLRMPAREVRKLDPAHVREVANSISALGFCVADPRRQGQPRPRRRGPGPGGEASGSRSRRPAFGSSHLTENEQRLLRLAVNRLGEKGEWNLDELKIEFEELILTDAPIEISGFTLDEIDHIVLGDAAEAVEQGPLAPEAARRDRSPRRRL